MPLTKAAAIVQRSRENLRGEYAKHEPLAKKLVATRWTKPLPPADASTKDLKLTADEQTHVRTGIETAAGLGIPRNTIVSRPVCARSTMPHKRIPPYGSKPNAS
ncbi:hypothetical protein ACWDA3_47195 [Nonomuraea rubra]